MWFFAIHASVIFVITTLYIGFGALCTALYIGAMKEQFPYFAPNKSIIFINFMLPMVAIFAVVSSYGIPKKLSLCPYTDAERYNNFRRMYGSYGCEDFREFLLRYPRRW